MPCSLLSRYVEVVVGLPARPTFPSLNASTAQVVLFKLSFQRPFAVQPECGSSAKRTFLTGYNIGLLFQFRDTLFQCFKASRGFLQRFPDRRLIEDLQNV